MLALAAGPVSPQSSVPRTDQPQSAPDRDYFVCPMHPEVRSPVPGECPKCRMVLVPAILDRIEYPMQVGVVPRNFRPGETVQLTFSISDPKTGKPVAEFLPVHTRLLHLFVISEDLQWFLHEHPELRRDGAFHYATKFPKPGMYRMLADFYPQGGMPQGAVATVFAPGVSAPPPKLQQDLTAKRGENLQFDLKLDPPEPVAGQLTRLIIRVSPESGLEQYLGAWAHMLAASDDLIDLIHDHPWLADGGPQMQFNVIFPRARTYRVWIQAQRNGVVNTAAFNVSASELTGPRDR
jgi:hypothetical protein